jgi:hypothetical protein
LHQLSKPKYANFCIEQVATAAIELVGSGTGFTFLSMILLSFFLNFFSNHSHPAKQSSDLAENSSQLSRDSLIFLYLFPLKKTQEKSKRHMLRNPAYYLMNSASGIYDACRIAAALPDSRSMD